jgi:hypothetical protein
MSRSEEASKIRRSSPERRETVAVLVLPALCVTSGLVWAYLGILAAASLDGQSSESYDAGNRAAFTVVFGMLCIACPAACSIAYFIAREAGGRRILAFLAGQLAAMGVVVGVVLLVT